MDVVRFWKARLTAGACISLPLNLFSLATQRPPPAFVSPHVAPVLVLANLERIEYNPELCTTNAIFLRVVDAAPESKFRVRGLHVSKSRTTVLMSKLLVDVVDLYVYQP